jgi:hypothetical protein
MKDKIEEAAYNFLWGKRDDDNESEIMDFQKLTEWVAEFTEKWMKEHTEPTTPVREVEPKEGEYWREKDGEVLNIQSFGLGKESAIVHNSYGYRFGILTHKLERPATQQEVAQYVREQERHKPQQPKEAVLPEEELHEEYICAAREILKKKEGEYIQIISEDYYENTGEVLFTFYVDGYDYSAGRDSNSISKDEIEKELKKANDTAEIQEVVPVSEPKEGEPENKSSTDKYIEKCKKWSNSVKEFNEAFKKFQEVNNNQEAVIPVSKLQGLIEKWEALNETYPEDETAYMIRQNDISDLKKLLP